MPAEAVLRGQRGIALISAMLIAALVTAGAVALAASQQFSTRRVANILSAELAQSAAVTLETEAASVLGEDIEAGQYDATDEAWATAAFVTHAGELEVTARLHDAQGLFNLTNLSSEPLYNGGGLETADDTVGSVNAGAEAGDAVDGTSENPPGAVLSTEVTSVSPVPQYGSSVAKLPARTGEQRVYTHGGQERILAEARSQGLLTPGARNARRAAQASAVPAGSAAAGGIPAATSADGTAAVAAEDAANGTAATAAGTTATGQAQAPDAIAEQRLRLLFDALNLDPEPVQAIMDWIDPDTETRFPNGAEDDFYTNEKPGYRAANRPFTTPRELLLVKGVTLEIYEALAPFVICLPQATAINLNTAPREVLRSLSPNLDGGAADILIKARETQPFTSLEAFTGHPLIQFRQIPVTGLAVQSEYFELRTVARDTRLEHRLVTLLRRNGDKVTTLRRWRENFDE